MPNEPSTTMRGLFDKQLFTRENPQCGCRHALAVILENRHSYSINKTDKQDLTYGQTRCKTLS